MEKYVKKIRNVIFWFLVKHNLLFRLVSKLQRKKKSFASNNFDLLISEIFNNADHTKYYIEIGANDGISQSNTKYLELYEKWNGLLIEPIPEIFSKLTKNRSKKNYFENVACVSFGYEQNEVKMTYSNLMSIVHDGESDIKNRIEHARSGLPHLHPGELTYELSVPALTMTALLEQAIAPAKISFLSLDVEGNEIEVLKGINFTIYSFHIILVECRQIEKLRNFLADKNYIYVSKVSHHDYLFRNRNFSIASEESIIRKYVKSEFIAS